MRAGRVEQATAASGPIARVSRSRTAWPIGS